MNLVDVTLADVTPVNKLKVNKTRKYLNDKLKMFANYAIQYAINNCHISSEYVIRVHCIISSQHICRVKNDYESLSSMGFRSRFYLLNGIVRDRDWSSATSNQVAVTTFYHILRVHISHNPLRQ